LWRLGEEPERFFRGGSTAQNRAPTSPSTSVSTSPALTAALALPEGDYQREILRLLKLAVPTYLPSPTGLGRYEQDSEERRTADVISRATSTLL